MKTVRFTSLTCAFFAVFLLASRLPADTIQLENGDTLHGKVLSVTDKDVAFQSDIHGKMTFERKRVAAIVLGDPRPVAGKPNPQPDKGADGPIKKGESPADVIRRLAPKDFGPKTLSELDKNAPVLPNPEDDVIRQLRTEGVDPALMNELKVRLPGFSSAPVQGYFNEKVNGLISGEISIQDIRNEAIEARDQLEDLKRDLGPDAAALDGYFGILDSFIKDTAPPAEKEPATTTPKPKAVAQPAKPKTAKPASDAAANK